jgi:hypothetical protein
VAALTQVVLGADGEDRIGVPSYPRRYRNLYGTAAYRAVAHEFLGQAFAEIDLEALDLAAIRAAGPHPA